MDRKENKPISQSSKYNTHMYRNNIASHSTRNVRPHDRPSYSVSNTVDRSNSVHSQSQFVPSPLQLQVQELEALYRDKIESKQPRQVNSDERSYLYHQHNNHLPSRSNFPADHCLSNTNVEDDSDDSSPPPVFHISSAADDDDDDNERQFSQIRSTNIDANVYDQKVPEFCANNDDLTHRSNYFTSSCTSSDIEPVSLDHQHQSHPSSLYEVDHSYEHVCGNFITIDSSNSSVMTSINSPSTIAALPCFTCCLLKKCGFFCLSCVQLGKFTSSKSLSPLKFTFSEKKYEYLHLQNEKNSLNSSIGIMLRNKIAKDILQEKVNQVTKRNIMLKEKLIEMTRELKLKKDQLVDLKPLQDQTNNSMRRKREKMSFAKEWTGKLRIKLRTKSDDLKKIQDSIRQVTWNLAVDLRKSIFNIDLYDDTHDGLNQSSDLDSRMPLLNCLNSMDVTSTLKQVNAWSYHGRRYTIVEPWIYGTNGDLAMYDNWMNEHRDDFSSTNSVMDVTSGNDGGNDALRVTASLTYLNHMIDIMAKLLDLKLPRKLQLNEFYHGNETSYSGSNLNQMKFRLAKLNVNIVYLCLSQNLDSNLVASQIRSPLSSFIDLLNPSFDADLGRRGPLSVDSLEIIDKIIENEFTNDLSLLHEPFYYPNSADYLDMTNDPEDLGFETISASAIDLLMTPTVAMSSDVSESPSTLFGPFNSYLAPANNAFANAANSLFNKFLPYVSSTGSSTNSPATPNISGAPVFGHNRSNASSPTSASSSFNPW